MQCPTTQNTASAVESHQEMFTFLSAPFVILEKNRGSPKMSTWEGGGRGGRESPRVFGTINLPTVREWVSLVEAGILSLDVVSAIVYTPLLLIFHHAHKSNLPNNRNNLPSSPVAGLSVPSVCIRDPNPLHKCQIYCYCTSNPPHPC